MTDKIQSMSKGTEKLSEIVHTVEFYNQNLLKSYDRLADRVSLQEGNLYTIQIMSKDECCGTMVFYPVTCIIFNKMLIGQ